MLPADDNFQLNPPEPVQIDPQLRKAIYLMVYLQERCARERLLPMRAVLKYFIDQMSITTTPPTCCSTLTDLGLDMDGFLRLLTDNYVYKIELFPMPPPALPDHLVKYALTPCPNRPKEFDGVIWLADNPQLKYEGVHIFGDVPEKLPMSQEELHQFIEGMYKIVDYTQVDSAALIGDSYSYVIPSEFYVGDIRGSKPQSKSKNQFVRVARYPFELQRLSSQTQKRYVRSIPEPTLCEDKQMTISPVVDIGQRFQLKQQFNGPLEFAEFLRVDKHMPQYIRKMPLGDIVEIINWLKLKQVIYQTLKAAAFLANPILNYPVVRHFIRTGPTHKAIWHCHMIKIRSDESIIRVEGSMGTTKPESEAMALKRLMELESGTKTCSSFHKTASDMTQEQQTFIRLDIQLFLFRRRPITYLELQTRGGTLNQCLSPDFPDFMAESKKKEDARVQIAKAVLAKLKQELKTMI